MRSLLRCALAKNRLWAFKLNILKYSSEDTSKKLGKQEDQKKTAEYTKNGKMKLKNVTVEKFGSSGSVTTISINNGHSDNRLNLETLNDLGKALDNFDEDKAAQVLIIHGNCEVFSMGFDLHEIQKIGYTTLSDAAKRLNRMPLCDKTTIAAVSGCAVDEGFELALICDLRVVEETANLGFVGRRFGMSTSAIDGTGRLALMIGLSRALQLSMTGELISGIDANCYGIANKITGQGNALCEALKLAKRFTKIPQNALLTDKLQGVNRYLDPLSDERLRNDAVIASLSSSVVDDVKVGVKKYLEGTDKSSASEKGESIHENKPCN